MSVKYDKNVRDDGDSLGKLYDVIKNHTNSRYNKLHAGKECY